MHFIRSIHMDDIFIFLGNKTLCKLATKLLNVACKYSKNNNFGVLSFIMSSENKSFSTIILILYKCLFW